MGPVRGTHAALALVWRSAKGPVRRRWLRRRPLRATPRELAGALGGRSASAQLRGVVLEAMPTVRAFEQELSGCSDEQWRAGLLARAQAVGAHCFDLLGSGPVALGEKMDWQRDFKSGRSWPLEHISKLPISYPDGSDIKVPWELSRFQHLPLLAAAHRLTGERRWLDELGAQLGDWIAANPVELGANWACTMDVAIRASNWIAALALVAEELEGEVWLSPVLSSLLLHGRFIHSHLEYAQARGNHYLSDIVGLLPVAALFSAGREGRRWIEWAATELLGELSHQVRPDGCDHEASIPYHRLVTELFICGVQALEALEPNAVLASHRAMLERMLRFTADYTRPDGLAPQVGDADDGRFLPLGDYGRLDHRSHLHLFDQAKRAYRPPSESAAYPHGGYWIMRFADIYVLVRCGDVGVGGLGSHAHNDALSFELAIGAHPLVIDPGSYLYTADPVERNRFRSTAFHSTLQIDGAEQNPLSETALFAMEDRRRAEALRWETSATGALFCGRHHGYAHLEAPATHTRIIELDGPTGSLKVTDVVESAAAHDLRWTFPLAPCELELSEAHAVARFDGGARLELRSSELELSVEEGWCSPSYGRRLPVPFLCAERRSAPGRDVTELTLRIHSS
jgi:uncharacterized heparinase superfamily protein